MVEESTPASEKPTVKIWFDNKVVGNGNSFKRDIETMDDAIKFALYIYQKYNKTLSKEMGVMVFGDEGTAVFGINSDEIFIKTDEVKNIVDNLDAKTKEIFEGKNFADERPTIKEPEKKSSKNISIDIDALEKRLTKQREKNNGIVKFHKDFSADDFSETEYVGDISDSRRIIFNAPSTTKFNVHYKDGHTTYFEIRRRKNKFGSLKRNLRMYDDSDRKSGVEFKDIDVEFLNSKLNSAIEIEVIFPENPFKEKNQSQIEEETANSGVASLKNYEEILQKYPAFKSWIEYAHKFIKEKNTGWQKFQKALRMCLQSDKILKIR